MSLNLYWTRTKNSRAEYLYGHVIVTRYTWVSSSTNNTNVAVDECIPSKPLRLCDLWPGIIPLDEHWYSNVSCAECERLFLERRKS